MSDRITQAGIIPSWSLPPDYSERVTRLQQETYDAVEDGLVEVPLNADRMPTRLVSLPWGSIVDVCCRDRRVSIIAGPARFQDTSKLPIWERADPKATRSKL